MTHLRDMTLEDLRAVSDQPAELNRLVHEMMRLDGPVSEDEAALLLYRCANDGGMCNYLRR